MQNQEPIKKGYAILTQKQYILRQKSSIMEFLITEDGSQTIMDQKSGEHLHTKSGAYEEALEKHVKPLKIEDGMSILDYCFGIGYNSFVAMSLHKDLTIEAIEYNADYIKVIPTLTCPQIQYLLDQSKQLQIKPELTDKNNNHLKVHIDTIENILPTLKDNSFDRVFFDPFSPKTQPELWSEELFKHIFRVLKPGGMLSTYSCARMARDNMKAAGLIVTDGPIIGRRSPSTIAIKPIA